MKIIVNYEELNARAAKKILFIRYIKITYKVVIKYFYIVINVIKNFKGFI